MAVVLHDVAPTTLGACERVLAAIEEVGHVPLTLLVVPRYHLAPTTGAFVQWLGERYARGDELALHGYTHQDDGEPRNVVDHLKRRHYTRGEGEFAGLSMTEAMRRLTAGTRWFARQGFVLRGFVAPAWLMSEGTWEALRWLDLSYTCTLRRIVLLPDRRAMVSQSLVYSTSSGWRRQASLVWNAAVATLERRNPVLRLELHPSDADHAGVRRSWQRLLEAQLGHRKPSTLADIADRFRISTDWDLMGSVESEPGEDEPEVGREATR
ncbi:polysaccharide deacetylase family protein [Piscinibacter sp.]|uniref:polysaccharide deacetylase family protein n=1 Tax=Piscinibacter sp. TaxID=1903157 RepID=UPI002ED44164